MGFQFCFLILFLFRLFVQNREQLSSADHKTAEDNTSRGRPSWCQVSLTSAGVTLCYCHTHNIVLQYCWSCTFILSYSFCNRILLFSNCRHHAGSNSLFVCTNVVDKVDSDNMRPITQMETFHLGCRFSVPVCPLCVTMLEILEMGEQKRPTFLCPLMSGFHTDRLKLWRHDVQFVYLKAWGTIVLCRSLMILKCQFPFSIYL